MSVIELRVPEVGESINEVTLSQWLKKDGDYVELDEAICEFESDKATLEFPAEAAGILQHIAKEDDDLEIGALVAKIDTSAQKPNDSSASKEDKKEPETKQEESSEKESSPEKSESYAEGHPSPAAAKLIKEHDLDADKIKGSGKDGRLTKEDVLQAVESQKDQPKEEKQSTKETASEKAAPSSSESKAFSRETSSKKMSRMRRTIAKRLLEAKHSTAMLTTFNEVDLSAIMQLRKTYQDKFVEKYGVKLGFMSLFAKACAKTLIEMPDVNAQIDGDQIIYHEFADISIAISTDDGLVVPPIRNAESKSFADIELEIKALANKARDGKLTLEEMSGGTFAITNGGIFGSMMSTPILNPPQSAILGMHNIIDRPVVVNGEIVVRPMMYLALSYDHRVIDGATSVTFLVKVKNLLEDPTTLLLDL